MPILETLPGWPHADDPSLMFVLLLLVIIPVAITVLFAVIGMAGRWRREDPAVERTADAPADGSHAVEAPADRAALGTRSEADAVIGDEVADLRGVQTELPSSARA